MEGFTPLTEKIGSEEVYSLEVGLASQFFDEEYFFEIIY
jgi:hypothetical protein